MALPASGQISLDDINVELGNSTGSQASMDTMTAAAVGDSNITNDAGFVFLINKAAGATSHAETVNASKSSNTYQYRVRAYNGAGDSAWSTGTQKTTSPTCIPT